MPPRASRAAASGATVPQAIAAIVLCCQCLTLAARGAETAGSASKGVHVSKGRGPAEIAWEKEFRVVYPETAYYPRAAAMADGRLLIAFAHPTPQGKAIACIQSHDGGKSWSGYHRVCEQPRPIDLDNAFPLQLADGSVLVAYRRHDHEGRQFRVEVSASEDRERWQFRSTVAAGSQGLWEPFLLLLPDGTIQAYYASEEGCHPDQRIEMRTSADGGKSWGPPRTVAAQKGSRDGMPGVVRLDARRLLTVFEAQDDPPFRFVIRSVQSSDLGLTWSSTRALVYRPRNPLAAPWSAGAPTIIQLPDGRLIGSFQSDERTEYVARSRRGDPDHPRYNYLRHTHFACVTSFDQGRSWTAPVDLLGGPDDPANWNALYGLRDGTVLALSTHRDRIWIKTGVAETNAQR